MKQTHKKEPKKVEKIDKGLMKYAKLISKKKMGELKTDIGFISAIFMMIGLPVKKLKGNAYTWTNKTKDYEITLQRHPDFEIPFGCYARHAQMWIDTEVKKKNTDTLNFGNSLTTFVKQLGFKKGKANKEILRQLLNLFTCRFIVRFVGKDHENRRTEIDSVMTVARDWYFDPKNMNQLDLWQSIVKLSPALATYIREHAVPIDLKIVSQFKDNALTIDLLRWLIYRNNGLRRNQQIQFDDKELFATLGTSIKNIRMTRKRVIKSFKTIQAIWPVKCGIKSEKQKHTFWLSHSTPLVASKPTAELLKRG